MISYDTLHCRLNTVTVAIPLVIRALPEIHMFLATISLESYVRTYVCYVHIAR